MPIEKRDCATTAIVPTGASRHLGPAFFGSRENIGPACSHFLFVSFLFHFELAV
jgi:hypothetical protein